MLNDGNEIFIQEFEKSAKAEFDWLKKIFSLCFTMFYIPKHVTASVQSACTGNG